MSTLDNLLDRMESHEAEGRISDARKAAYDVEKALARPLFGKRLEHARGLCRLAGFYSRVGETADARPLLLKAIEVFRKKDKDGLDFSSSMMQLAHLEQDVGDEVRARGIMEEAAGFLRSIDTYHPRAKVFLAGVLNDLAGIAIRGEDLGLAETWLSEAVSLSERFEPGSVALIAYYRNRADLLEYQGRLEEAAAVYERALTLAVELKETADTIYIVDRLQSLYLGIEETSHSSFWESQLDHASVAEAGMEIWGVLMCALCEDHHAEGLVDMEPVLEGLVEVPPGSLGQAIIERTRARLARNRGQMGAAVRSMRKAVEILMAELDEQDGISVSARIELGDLHGLAGNLESALAVFQSLGHDLEEAGDLESPDLPLVYVRLAETMYDLGDNDGLFRLCESVEQFFEGRGMYSHFQAKMLFYHGQAEFERGNTGAARERLEKSLRISRGCPEPETQAACYFHLSSVYQILGELDRAIVCVEKARSKYGEAGYEEKTLLGDLWARLSSIHASKGDREKSMEFADKALDIWAETKAESLALPKSAGDA